MMRGTSALLPMEDVGCDIGEEGGRTDGGGANFELDCTPGRGLLTDCLLLAGLPSHSGGDGAAEVRVQEKLGGARFVAEYLQLPIPPEVEDVAGVGLPHTLELAVQRHCEPCVTKRAGEKRRGDEYRQDKAKAPGRIKTRCQYNVLAPGRLKARCQIPLARQTAR